MKTNSFWQTCSPVIMGILVYSLTSPMARGAWGSIRANNRSAIESHPGSRPAPEISRGRVEPARPTPERPRVEPQREREVERGRQMERGREIEGERREAFEHEARERRHLDIDADRHHLYYWSGFAPGAVIGTLPLGYAPLYVGATPYYYYQGVYYQNSPSGYVVVTPPTGATVAELPPGAESIPVGNVMYYYAGGAFYVQQPQGGFMVVAPPMGITVDSLPDGASPVNINGVLYYQANGAYFLPEMQGGVTVYQSVRPQGYY